MQKIILTLVTALMLTFQAQAQSTAAIIVFAENGETFTAYLNGKQMNSTPESRVSIPELGAEFYKLKLDFEDPTLPDFNGNMMVERGMELTYMAKLNRKGKYVIRPVSEAPYTADATAEPVAPAPTSRQTAPAPTQKTSSPESVTTETTTTTTGGSDGMSMDIDMAGTKMSVDVKVPGMEVEESTTVTTTTTSSTTTYQTEEVVEDEEIIVVEETGNCGIPMGSGDFSSAKSSIESKGFEDSKMTLARQITKSNCLDADQVKEIMGLFGFEDTKLEFAKFAYDYTVDQNNYYKVNDAFNFESSIEELDEYLESK